MLPDLKKPRRLLGRDIRHGSALAVASGGHLLQTRRTARHATQAFWNVGLGGDDQRAATEAALARRFRDCADYSNTTLVRTDVVTALAPLDSACPDADSEQIASDLIDDKPDATQRHKQTAAWNKSRPRPS